MKITIDNTSKTEHNLEIKTSGKNSNEFSMKINDFPINAEKNNAINIFNVALKNSEQVVVCLSK